MLAHKGSSKGWSVTATWGLQMCLDIFTAAHKCSHFLKKRFNGFLATKYLCLLINLSLWDQSPAVTEDK